MEQYTPLNNYKDRRIATPQTGKDKSISTPQTGKGRRVATPQTARREEYLPLKLQG